MKERIILVLSILLLIILVGGIGTYISYGYLIGSLIESVLAIGLIIGVPGLLVVFGFFVYWKENGE